jgi:hypothetical protein
MASAFRRIIQGSFAPAARRPTSGTPVKIDPAILGTAVFSGRPLPAALQARMSVIFRQNFSDIRVQIGPQAARLGAEAFAMGANLYFSPGRFQPSTPDGQRLIAHELAHVVQQRAGRVPLPATDGLFLVHDPALEAEAARMARLATTPHAGVTRATVQRKTGGVLQRSEGLEGLNLDLGPGLSFGGPIVRLWTLPPRIVPNPQPQTPLPQPVKIFDIRRQGLPPIPFTPSPGTILVQPPPPVTSQERQKIRQEIEDDLEETWRKDEEKDVRARYNEVHGELIDLKYPCLALIGRDITARQLLMLDRLLGIISTETIARSRVLGASPKARLEIELGLTGCKEWIRIVTPVLDPLAACEKIIIEVVEIIEQLTLTYETRQNLHKRQSLGKALTSKTSEWAKLSPICPLFWKTAIECDNQPSSLRALMRAAKPIMTLLGPLKQFYVQIFELGGEFEDAESRTPKGGGSGRVLSQAEQLVVTAWNLVYGTLKSPFMDGQIQKIVTTGDFEMLKELTAIIDHIQKTGGARYKGVDIHPHPLTGALKGYVSYDFPFLNKDRCGHTNRGIWRIVFQKTRIYGIYDDHNGNLDKWKGEGLKKTAA